MAYQTAMTSSNQAKGCYAEFTHPALKDHINQNNTSALKLAILVAEFAQQMAAAHEHFSKEIQSVISSFRRKNYELLKERPVDTPSSIYNAWETLLQETELDAQAHLDAASLLIKSVYKPLEEMATYKQSQAQRLNVFREHFDNTLQKVQNQLECAEEEYKNSYTQYQDCSTPISRENAKAQFYNAHNEYVFQIRASNRTIDEFQMVIPKVLEELEEIYIDTSNTVNVAIESHALLLLTKANEQHKRFDELLKVCRQVNPQLDISWYVEALNPECPRLELHHPCFHPADITIINSEESMKNTLIVDRSTEVTLYERRCRLQKEAAELTSYIKQNQDITHTLVNICQRNLANHLYAKVYETQEDMCRKRNEIRIANMQLAAVRAQIDLFTSKQNGSVEDMSDKKSAASIKGMWKKAVKNLKTASESKIIKKGSFIKKKQISTESDEPEPAPSGEIDPVYSLLKCAADLPKGGPKACGIHSQCSGHHSSIRRGSPGAGGDSSGNTSKTSSPSSSASHSPKGRRKKLNARMKSFSLDTPEPSKHHLGIDEITKKKSSSFTNTCFGAGSSSPVDKYSAVNLRKKFAASAKTTSLDIEDKKRGSFVPSPKESPKAQRKQSKEVNTTVYVALYNFRGKEKDDMDLRAGWRLFIVDSSDPDWWKGKCNGKVGYFPAKYVIPLQFAQRVYQVTQPMHLTEGGNGIKLHKDQIVLQVGDEVENGMILVRSASNKQALCPVKYLNEI
ncbi:uncharacterized protein LOC110445468 [Mizuhopecten yessoensis]|uniref:uncharacterized protein LOC110445468 n=1 Tax=Mizuhopecten yessoensis TaxID=6573 RepID=UPI000B4597EB|nr:uncharacterized protein LOC110445468 [Mizuhopecten yessoensis]